MKKYLFRYIIAAVLTITPIGIMAIAASSDNQSIENLASGPRATGSTGFISLVSYSSDTNFTIYSITGQVVKSLKVASGTSINVELPAGFYIVKCHAWSRKVVVK